MADKDTLQMADLLASDVADSNGILVIGIVWFTLDKDHFMAVDCAGVVLDTYYFCLKLEKVFIIIYSFN